MSSTGATASYTRCSMRVPAGRSCRSSQNVILFRSGINLRWRGQRRDRSDRRQKFLAATYGFECLPEGEEGPLDSSNEHSGIQRQDDRAEQGEIGSGSSLPWRARGSQSLCRIWVIPTQLRRIKSMTTSASGTQRVVEDTG